jgi:GT2 family glycosyltransferase
VPSAQNPLISVVIPTLNREGPLCTTLEYFLEREEYRPFEVIVIDQSERHDQATTEFLAKNAGNMRLVNTPFKSLTRARNHGVGLAEGEIVVFVDDDTEPFEGFLAGHASPYRDDRIWMATGPVLAPGEKFLERGELDEARYERIIGGDEFCVQARFDYAPCLWAPGCNFSARKSAIERAGGFDESFHGVAVGEDAEFSHRIRTIGGMIFYSAAAALIHNAALSGGCRDVPSDAYVDAYAFNLNYFWRKVGGGWRKRLGANWVAYRQLVLTRRMLGDRSPRNAYRLHRAFLSGAIRGLRRPIVARARTIEAASGSRS